MTETEEPSNDERTGLRRSINGLGQVIIGEIEAIGGVLTGDPVTQAEGEFNVEIGTVREGIEHDLEESEADGSHLDEPEDAE